MRRPRPAITATAEVSTRRAQARIFDPPGLGAQRRVDKVSPKDSTATLTKMKDAIRDQKDWTLPLHGEDPVTPTALVLLGMVQALIAAQPDRHAGDGSLPEVSQEAAEAAVMLAVPLVQWFTSGAAARRL